MTSFVQLFISKQTIQLLFMKERKSFVEQKVNKCVYILADFAELSSFISLYVSLVEESSPSLKTQDVIYIYVMLRELKVLFHSGNDYQRMTCCKIFLRTKVCTNGSALETFPHSKVKVRG